MDGPLHIQETIDSRLGRSCPQELGKLVCDGRIERGIARNFALNSMALHSSLLSLLDRVLRVSLEVLQASTLVLH